MDEKNIKHSWNVNLCLSSKCDRGCSHCSANASLNGNFFTLKQAKIFVDNLKRFSEKVFIDEGINLGYRFGLTGDGEIMMNPHFPQIIDILFGSAANVEARIVTSGVNSDKEEKRLLGFLSRSYASRIEWILSFNLFQSEFPDRLSRTLELIFENGVEKAVIKITLPPRRVYKTMIKLNDVIVNAFSDQIREIMPLVTIDEADFVPSIISSEVDKMMKEIDLDIPSDSGFESDKFQEALRNIRIPTEITLIDAFVHLNTNFNYSFSFKTKYGEKTIVYAPQHLVRRGRATALNGVPWGFKDIKIPCYYLRSSRENITPIHIGADGYYYPTCDCPMNENLRIGHIGDEIMSIMTSFYMLNRLLPYCMIKNKRWYDDICDHCCYVMWDLRNQGILKKIGIQ